MIRRRDFIKNSAASLLAGSAISTPAFAKKKRFRWRLVMPIAKTLPIWGEGVVNFAKKVKLLSDGDLDIRVYGAGELVPAMGVLDAVSAGRVEMGHSASYYWQGKIPSAVFFTCVPFGLDANGFRAWMGHGGGQELWDEAYRPFGILGIPAGNTGMQMGGWFKKKISSIEDFKGLKMRIPGLGGAVVEKAGAKPMLVAGGEIFTSLSTGVIDAAEWVGPYHDHIMGLHKAANYYYAPGFHEPGPNLELMINQTKWDQLPASLQELVRTCSAELDRNMLAEWVAKDAEYLEKFRNEKQIEILEYPKQVQIQMKVYADQVLDELAKKDPMSKKVLTSFRAFQSSYEDHYRTMELSYWQNKLAKS